MSIHTITAFEPRKTPIQARSTVTVDAISEAAIQVLLTHGAERLTTTRVADRAGVSVGTLYQYYPNKQSLLFAVLENHLTNVMATVEAACESACHRPLAEMIREMVEAFVDARDIAAVAVETLADPDAHAGAVYAPTGPEALTVAEVARIIAGVAGRPVTHNDIERSVWIDGAIAAGAVPADYGVMLNWLTATIASGHGSRPNNDVRRVTGSPPASFADFAHRNARAWAAPAALS